MTFIPLSESYLCSDCQVIGDNPRHCPKCQSSAVFGLFRFIPVIDSTLSLKTPPAASYASAIGLPAFPLLHSAEL